VLLNCSPDVRAQIMNTRVLHPAQGSRHSPVAAVVLTNGDVDHVAGLLSLRESQPFAVHGTQATLDAIAENRIFGVVNEALVPRQALKLDRGARLPGGIDVVPFAVPGKVPLYLEESEVVVGRETEETVGLKVSAEGRSLFYVPGCADVTPALRDRLRGAALVLFDGTLWQDDEMIREGLGTKTGSRMGHVSMSGNSGSMAGLAGLGIERKVFVHINNTNPVLVDGSPEREEAQANGWEIAYDGMEIEL
jgi:pyrroloquinoline quinone biosynthesis protein B